LRRGFRVLLFPHCATTATDLPSQLDQVAVIDHRTVITGSFNWSPSAAHQNDETLLVFDSPLLAAHFTTEIDRLWKGAELGITERLARKQERQQNRCGSGVRRG
jgi:phosphatidylserine/phosphatidylglycerophosphate/cardiolipin synthase-like enzyme